jgi:hypothetical protein
VLSNAEVAELVAQQAEREAGNTVAREQRSTGAKKQPIAVWRTKLCVMTNLQFKRSGNEVKGNSNKARHRMPNFALASRNHYDFALDLSAAGLHIAI